MIVRPYFQIFSPQSSLVFMYVAKIKITHLWMCSFYHTHGVNLLNYLTRSDQSVSLGLYYYMYQDALPSVCGLKWGRLYVETRATNSGSLPGWCAQHQLLQNP
jgi:hypothetical protein